MIHELDKPTAGTVVFVMVLSHVIVFLGGFGLGVLFQ